jgi:hypothetical protein
MMSWKGCGRKLFWPNLRNYRGMRRVSGRSAKNLSQHSVSHARCELDSICILVKALVPASTLSKVRTCTLAVDDDIDGEPLSEDLTGDSKSKLASMPAGFVPSRWETVDPEQVEAQAMTTSKWDLLEQTEQPELIDGDDPDSAGGDDSQEGDYQNYDVR